ncbi:nuclease-related domain-containing protein [Streptomyces sp. NPDC021100]|uniref:nuclease-related domain-containing protein n=1 Tax=Streptomyces sp. NPDC021100 TaxID=3365114 RepID=UPI0037949E9F
MAIRLRAVERAKQHRTALWAMPPLLAVALGTGYAVAAACGAWPAGVATAAAIAITGLRYIYRSKGSSWATGAAGERRTARLLAPLSWSCRYAVLHDRAVPNSRANLDHLVIGRAGPLYIDTKTWTSKKSAVRLRRGELWYGNYSQTRALATVRWEADQAAKALGWPVQAVVAVHGATVPGGRIHFGDVTVIQAAQLRRYIKSLPAAPGWDRAMIRETTRVAEQRLKPASGR